MTLKASNIAGDGGSSVEALDAGSYPARVVWVIDLGIQPQSFNGEEKPPRNELYINYELADEFMIDEDGNDDEDKPRWQNERFALFSQEVDRAKSTKRYLALDPKNVHEGDWAELLEAPCNVQLVQKESKGKMYANVSGVSGMRDKDARKAPALVNPTKLFTMDDPDVDVFNSLSDYVKGLITGGLEFEGSELDKLLKAGKPKKKIKVDEAPEPESDSDDDGDDDAW